MISFGTVWAVGAINGYLLPDHGLPTGYKYGAIALASGMQMVKAIGSDTFRDVLPKRPVSSVIGIFFGIPIITGAVFCTGSYLGKSIKYLVDHGSFPYFQQKSIVNELN